MAIQFRRGAFADFIKSKMVAGEPAVVQSGDTSTQSGKAFYICYTPGSVDRVLTEQDKTVLDSQISDIEDDLAAAEQAIENVRQSIPAVDATLTTTGAAADAKKTGDEISGLKSDLEQIVPGLSDEAKVALLNCFAHVAFLDGDADYYGALESALYENSYPRISAELTIPSGVKIYPIDDVDILRNYLTVYYHEDEETVSVVTNYTLSGAFSIGTSKITVLYNGKTTSVNVPVSGWPTTPVDEGWYLAFNMGTDGYRYSSMYETSSTGRVTFEAPVKINRNYKFTIIDPQTYSMKICECLNDQLVNYHNATLGDQEGYKLCTTSSYGEWTSEYTTSHDDYVMLGFRRNDNTPFTSEEIANAYGTIFTVEAV